MLREKCLVVLAGLAALLLGVPAPAAEAVKEKAKKPKVEVVFCLDTTGSMGGLIDGAKQKIWAICNQIAGGKPTPDLKVGLVAYRDRGDEYVTKVFDLTSDLDTVHAELKKFVANGGGDEPESVNQALDDSVNKIKWSTDKKTLRIIFLVGDAAPHMDYPDDVKYPVSCKKAVEKGIIINTIQCGTSAECTKYWKDIAVKSEGSYAAIPQEGGVVAVATPFDARLAELNTELTRTTVVYGKKADRDMVAAGFEAVTKLPEKEAAERAGFAGKTRAPAPGLAGRSDPSASKPGEPGAGPVDLVTEVKDGRVKLKDLKDENLPEDFKKLKTEKERKEYLEKLEKKRAELNKEAIELDKKRSEYIKKELETKGKGKDSFDGNVLEMLRKQAKKYDLGY
jgi:Mg-chelatase subunit ChlD